jgi:hypothetical protein
MPVMFRISTFNPLSKQTLMSPDEAKFVECALRPISNNLVNEYSRRVERITTSISDPISQPIGGGDDLLLLSALAGFPRTVVPAVT